MRAAGRALLTARCVASVRRPLIHQNFELVIGILEHTTNVGLSCPKHSALPGVGLPGDIEKSGHLAGLWSLVKSEKAAPRFDMIRLDRF